MWTQFKDTKLLGGGFAETKLTGAQCIEELQKQWPAPPESMNGTTAWLKGFRNGLILAQNILFDKKGTNKDIEDTLAICDCFQKKIAEEQKS